MEIIIMVAQLVLGLSLLVGLHELGHMLPAKWFGMRVEQFFIGFPPKLFKIKRGETEYGIGSIPVGGYVKISGMIDESLDVKSMREPAKPWEFRSKPAWQRLIVMIGGVTVNLITGVVIFIGITYSFGEKYLPASEAKYGIVAYPLAEEIGLKTGDKILKVNGKDFERFYDILSPDVLLGSKSYYTIDRGGQIINIAVPDNFIDKISSKRNQADFADAITPFSVGQVMPGSPAEKAGLQEGDIITAIDSVPTLYFHQLQAALQQRKGKDVKVSVLRGEQPLTLGATLNEEGKLGFHVEPKLKYATEKYGLGQSVAYGTAKAFTIVWVQMKAFRKMIVGEIDVKNSLSGPIGIAREFGGTWDWLRFWTLTGMLSMVLAFMNLLPIPALDGGHVMFLTYEIITGRKPADKFMEIAQRVGMAILLSLMAFAFLNDIIKLVWK